VTGYAEGIGAIDRPDFPKCIRRPFWGAASFIWGTREPFWAKRGLMGRCGAEVGGYESLPFDWFKNTGEGRAWHDVPPEAWAAFPSVAEILARRVASARKFQSSNLEIPYRRGAALCA
jgi:hypothetical protein